MGAHESYTDVVRQGDTPGFPEKVGKVVPNVTKVV
jgi:hypothetical protein